MSFDLVFFGGTGDLTWRKLMPALFQAFRHGKLPAGGRILAVARDDRSDDEYRSFIKERFARPLQRHVDLDAGALREHRLDHVAPVGLDRTNHVDLLCLHERRRTEQQRGHASPQPLLYARCRSKKHAETPLPPALCGTVRVPR